MKGIEYLRQAREEYLERYRRVLHAKREEGADCTVEVWVEPNVPPGQPRMPHPLCIDILVKGADGPSMARVSDLSGEGSLIDTIQIGAAPARIYATRWEDMAAWFRSADPDWSRLELWQKKWMDVDRGQSDDDEDFCGVVHYLGRPVAEGGGHLFQMDFGSAPIQALTELLDCFVEMGATEIELGRSDGSDLPDDVRATLQSPDLSAGQVTDLVCRLLSDIPEIDSVERLSDEAIAFQMGPKGHPSRVFTNNLHRMLLRTGTEARPKEMYRFIRGQREGMVPESAPDLAQLRVLVKDDRFFESVKQSAPGMRPMVRQHLAADLWLVCVWDAPNGMRFASEGEPGKYELSAAQMIQRAVDNYLSERPPVELAEDGAMLVARTGDCYDATLLIDGKWLDEISEKVSGELLACVPSRSLVLIGGSDNRQTVPQMRRAAQRIEAGGDHLISNTILVRRGGAWEAFAPPQQSADSTTGTSPPTQSRQKTRPWWRFWA